MYFFDYEYSLPSAAVDSSCNTALSWSMIFGLAMGFLVLLIAHIARAFCKKRPSKEAQVVKREPTAFELYRKKYSYVPHVDQICTADKFLLKPEEQHAYIWDMIDGCYIGTSDIYVRGQLSDPSVQEKIYSLLRRSVLYETQKLQPLEAQQACWACDAHFASVAFMQCGHRILCRQCFITYIIQKHAHYTNHRIQCFLCFEVVERIYYFEPRLPHSVLKITQEDELAQSTSSACHLAIESSLGEDDSQRKTPSQLCLPHDAHSPY